MSYDIRFGVRVAGTDKEVYAVIGEPERSSPTYNVGDILRKSMDWDFEQSKWYPVKEIIPKIERGIHELGFNASKYKHMEPDNGWGSVGGALEALQSIMKYLTEEIQWSWNGDIPIDCIYMCW